MEENEFWITFWKIIGAVTCVSIVTVGGCTVYETSRIADAVQAGKDPIDARCSIGGWSQTLTICAIRAAHR